MKKVFSKTNFKSTKLFWAVVLGISALIVFAYLQRGEFEKGRDLRVAPPKRELSKEEILRSLSAPSDAPQYTDEEKKEILESLSAPSDQSTLTDEEKESILESLSVPVE